MKWAKTFAGGMFAGVAATALLATAGLVQAEEMNFPEIDGVTLVTKVAPPEGHPLSEIISGLEFRTEETKEQQLDDFNNPGFLLVDQAEENWSEVEGSAGKSCASCHNDAAESMKGVRAAMPKWNEKAGRPYTLENSINACRTERMGAEAWKWEADTMLGMTAYVGLQSRGMPVDIDVSGPMQPWFDKGKDLYYTRVGQLDMSCSNCHEDNYGNYIRADKLSQGQSNGFPTYRFKWQKVGSLHRRFKGCMENIRATAYKRGSDEFVALETYLAWRGIGLSVETPSVRN